MAYILHSCGSICKKPYYLFMEGLKDMGGRTSLPISYFSVLSFTTGTYLFFKISNYLDEIFQF